MPRFFKPENTHNYLKFAINVNLLLGLFWLVFWFFAINFRYDIFNNPVLNKLWYYQVTLDDFGNESGFANDFNGHAVGLLCFSLGIALMSVCIFFMKNWTPEATRLLAIRFMKVSFGIFLFMFIFNFVFIGLLNKY